MNDIMEWFSYVLSVEIKREWFILGMVLFATSLLVLSIGFILSGIHSPLRKKLNNLSVKSPPALKNTEAIEGTLESLSPMIAPTSLKERESTRRKLMHAGFHDKRTLTNFYALKVLSVIVGLFIATAAYFLFSELSMIKVLMLVIVAISLFTPSFILNHLISKRQSSIRGGMPDALDLLVVCTESGLGFIPALQRVSDELTISHNELADELYTVSAKIKAGVEMPDAFNEFIERTGVIEFSGLVSILSHASRIGGSIAQTLRDYTEDLRDKRNQEAEEIAAKIPTKMLFPMLLFIWPCFFIVALGPALITLSNAFSN
ncbi:type II secretion system F family protein [Aliivibrio fischeri]|uniref:type II secretion system F family protein n=1 Tax=Aliivibrio fischeri TaxID=668 RepID=UPI00080E90BC|nr:type II secretion system F family protein [Aliivibrio fischeri]OCH36890.1 pilus assembly protein TadC [Aliivibrio fischeri]OED56212.1 pilus assembly protein TadC [Aliivibrio fischeri]